MSNLSIGDKVKFLNASGGGVVVRVIDTRMVTVMTSDGFEMPTLVSELVKIDPGNPAARFFDEQYKVETPALPPAEAESEEDDRHRPLPGSLSADRKSGEIWLAFVPHDQKWLITGQVDVFLINNSSYDVLYNIFSRTAAGHYTGVDYGSIFPDSSILVRTINREQLNHWTEGCLQFLFHRDRCDDLIPPFNSEFKLDAKRFQKEGNYREHRLIQAKGILVRVISLNEMLSQRNIDGSPGGDEKNL
jgi:hypothetical protein